MNEQNMKVKEDVKRMKTKFILLLLLINSNLIQAQKTDSTLWSSFQTELEKIIRVQTHNEFTINNEDYMHFSDKEFWNLLLNTPIEQKGMDYIAQNYGRDSLVFIRNFARSVFETIAAHSADSLSRQKAINYILDYALYPSISNYLLTDFNEEAKHKIIKLIRRQYSEEELNFFAVSESRRDTIRYNHIFQLSVQEYIQKQKQRNEQEISYQEASRMIFQSRVSDFKERLRKFPDHDIELMYLRCIILNAGQLNIKEAIPYLKEYANSDKYDEETRKHAACALAMMHVEDYEDRVVSYFDIDSYNLDTWLAKIINSQKVWYAYMGRLKSQKYDFYCPVAYSTMTMLSNVLKNFPTTDRPSIEWVKLDDGGMLPIHSRVRPISLVPDECRSTESTTKVPINPAHIKIVVDWMEANKGKYELITPVTRTYY